MTKKSFNPRPLIGMATLVIVFMMFFGLIDKLHNSQIADKYIQNVQSDIERLKVENEYLRKFIQYTNTDSFAERKAKEILHRQDDGEIVVSFPLQQQKIAYKKKQELEEDITSLDNITQWEYFFFHNKESVDNNQVTQ